MFNVVLNYLWCAYALKNATDGGLFQIICFDEIHNNFPNFITTPITKTEQEIGFVSPSYKCNVTNN